MMTFVIFIALLLIGFGVMGLTIKTKKRGHLKIDRFIGSIVMIICGIFLGYYVDSVEVKARAYDLIEAKIITIITPDSIYQVRAGENLDLSVPIEANKIDTTNLNLKDNIIINY